MPATPRVNGGHSSKQCGGSLLPALGYLLLGNGHKEAGGEGGRDGMGGDEHALGLN